MAAAIDAAGTELLYIDCNAIAPSTAQSVAAEIQSVGSRVADIGIVGAPPRKPGTRFYASGPNVEDVRELANYGLDIRVIGSEMGQASGLKMCYGALTKGLQALGVELLVAAQRARACGSALRRRTAGSVPDVRTWLERSVPTMPPKAYRWVGEMEEIARTFADVGLTPLIFQGAADLYRFVPLPTPRSARRPPRTATSARTRRHCRRAGRRTSRLNKQPELDQAALSFPLVQTERGAVGCCARKTTQ